MDREFVVSFERFSYVQENKSLNQSLNQFEDFLLEDRVTWN